MAPRKGRVVRFEVRKKKKGRRIISLFIDAARYFQCITMACRMHLVAVQDFYFDLRQRLGDLRP